MDDFLSDEDKALFRKAVDDLKNSKNILTESSNIMDPKNKSRNVSHYSHDYKEEVYSETILVYDPYHLPKKQFLAFRSGNFPFNATLDLHGLSADSASDKLHRFIHDNYLLTNRYLLIIHGKGGYGNKVSVLKSHVNTWLKDSSEVLAFHSAHAKHGGSGALYVLLKKSRIKQ